MSLPKISVVTPSFNQARYIESNIASVLAQGYPSVEHLVIDGGSTDGTLDVLRRHGHLVWSSGPDGGQSDALNRGFRKASGEIVGWLNSDDTYCPGVFREVAALFDDPEVMFVHGDGYEIDGEGKVLRPMISKGVSFEGLVRFWRWEYEFVQPAFFFRRSVFEKVGYLDESLFYTMDYDFFIRLCRAFEPRHLAKPLASLRLHDASKTGRVYRRWLPPYIREMLRVSRRYWGPPASARWISNAASFGGALCRSVVKNILFLPGSKSRARIGTTSTNP